jgi:hypothetical protein
MNNVKNYQTPDDFDMKTTGSLTAKTSTTRCLKFPHPNVLTNAR